MNPYTGHLVRIQDAVEPKEKEFRDNGYEPIPPELEGAANKKLAGKGEAMVSLTSGGKLSKWAAEKRKARRKMAKKSRGRNRK